MRIGGHPSLKGHHENNPFELRKALEHCWTAPGMEYHGEWSSDSHGSGGMVCRWIWRHCRSWRALEYHRLRSDPGRGVTNARLNDLALKSGLLEGAKGGYFFESRPWLGIETDLYTLKPAVKQQTVVGGTASGSVFADSIGPIPFRLSVWAVNLIIRSPSMSEVFQPYGGIGYGLFFATGSEGGLSNTQINPGFQFVAGARYVLTPEWAFFGEFKYNNTEIRVNGIHGHYDSQNFAAGLMWHFGR